VKIVDRQIAYQYQTDDDDDDDEYRMHVFWQSLADVCFILYNITYLQHTFGT